MEDMHKIRQLYYGYYSTNLYLPFSSLSRKWQRFRNRIKGKEEPFLQPISLPGISWKKFTNPKLISLLELEKRDGNVRISELGILSHFARNCKPNTPILEIGTFDGRTTINLALNAPENCPIYTLDLPPNTETKYSIDPGEQHYVDKPEIGFRYKKYKNIYRQKVSRIHQLLGDSATFDFSGYMNKCSLIFIDGSHNYEYIKSDTKLAMELVEQGGVILWHDYGIWKGVTQALDEIEDENRFGLKNISGTSLVCWRKEFS